MSVFPRRKTPRLVCFMARSIFRDVSDECIIVGFYLDRDGFVLDFASCGSASGKSSRDFAEEVMLCTWAYVTYLCQTLVYYTHILYNSILVYHSYPLQ